MGGSSKCSRVARVAAVLASLAVLASATTVSAGFADVTAPAEAPAPQGGVKPLGSGPLGSGGAGMTQHSFDSIGVTVDGADDALIYGSAGEPSAELTFTSHEPAGELRARPQLTRDDVPAPATVAAPLPPAVLTGAALLVGNLFARRLIKRRLV